MKPATAFHDEVKRKVGHVQTYLVPADEPRWGKRAEPFHVPSAIDKLFPTNAVLATAMGLGRPGQHKEGTRAWRKRKNLLDDAARWRRSARDPHRRGGHGARLVSAARKEQRRLARPNTEGDVLDLMVRYGVTVVAFEAHTDYDDRDRDFRSDVFVRPSVLAYAFADADSGTTLPSFSALVLAGGRRRWGDLFAAFTRAWSFAYSGDANLFGDQVDAVDRLSFRIGRTDTVDYEMSLGQAA